MFGAFSDQVSHDTYDLLDTHLGQFYSRVIYEYRCGIYLKRNDDHVDELYSYADTV